MTAIDTQHCPICGCANQCAVTAGKAIELCWCMTTEINPASLDKLPEESRGRSCICPNCATAITPDSDIDNTNTKKTVNKVSPS